MGIFNDTFNFCFNYQKSQSPCKSNESDIVFAKPESDQINEEPCEGSQKAENDSNSLGLPAPAETLENSGSSQSAESLPDRDKSEKKVDENDDLSPAEA